MRSVFFTVVGEEVKQIEEDQATPMLLFQKLLLTRWGGAID